MEKPTMAGRKRTAGTSEHQRTVFFLQGFIKRTLL